MTNNNNIVEEVQGAEATTEGKVNMMFPTELLKKLEVLFADDKIDFNKVLFTVYWINKGKYNSLKGKNESYQEVSSRYGNWISLIGKKGTDFIKKLVDGGIIKKVSGYVTAKHYTRYTLVNPFDYKGGDATGDIWTIYTLYAEDGAFIKKYLSDKHVVRISSTVNKTKNIVKEIKTVESPVQEEVVDIATGEVFNVFEEIKNIKMTLQELMNKMTALENENAELRNALNNKADIVSTLKNEIQQHTTSRLEEPITFEKPDVIDVHEADDDKANTPFFTDEDDIDFGEDLFNKVNALIAADDDIDFTQIFDENGDFEKPKVTLKSIKSPMEKQLNTILRRHIKSAGDINKLVKFITANNDSLITAQQLLGVGVGMSGATANRLIDDLKIIQFSPN